MTSEFATELALLDFKSEYATDQKRALYRLQYMLLKEAVCQRRILFLGSACSSDGDSVDTGKVSNLEDTVHVVGRFGVIESLDCGEVDVAALHALSCNAGALWRAHIWLSCPDGPFDQARVGAE